MTIEEQEEAIARKLSSQYWRMNNLYPVENEKGKVVIFRMNDVQKILHKNLWWLNDVPKSRQHGISTYFEKLFCDTSLFNSNMNCGIVDKSMPDASKKLAKMKFAWDNMDDPEICPKTHLIGRLIKERIKLIKSNESEMEFSNGSKIWCGVSLRGGTVQRLLITELGAISYYNPERAEEIRAGAFNTVHEGSIVAIESTHEGGKFGLNYEMIRLAQQSPPNRKDMNRMHWQLHFFGWWQDPKNSLPVDSGYESAITPELELLFSEKEELCRMKLRPEQKYWYAMKRQTQKDKMSKEHPFDVEEAISAAIKGAIYGQEMREMRNDGRICDFPWDRTSPFFCFWDMGKKDFMCMELMQHDGRYWSTVDSFAFFGKGERFYHQKVLEWERKYGLISMHFMPWDAGNAGDEGPSWVNSFSKLGMTNVRTVPRTNDKWVGINHLRPLLSQMRIHATNCDKEISVGDVKIPSLITSMESYHVKIEEKDGKIHDIPVHGPESHHCFVKGTKILTNNGDVAVEMLAVGDFVSTPNGERRIVSAFKTDERRVVRLEFSNGKTLTCTGDHPFFTENGIVNADELRTFVEVWNTKTDLRSLNSRKLDTNFRGGITSLRLQRGKITATFIERFGQMFTEQYQKATTSTIKTITHLITCWKTLKQLSVPSIGVTTLLKTIGLKAAKQQNASSRKLFQSQRNGTHRRLDGNGIRNTESEHGKTGSRRSGIVFIAPMNSWPLLITMFFAVGFVSREIGKELFWRLRRPVRNVALPLWTRLNRSVRSSARQSASGLTLVRRSEAGKAPVYNIEVESDHCFYAEGLLVSNCDGMRTFSEAHSKGMLNEDYGLSNNGRGTPSRRQVTVDRGGYDDSYGRQQRSKVSFGSNGGVRIRY